MFPKKYQTIKIEEYKEKKKKIIDENLLIANAELHKKVHPILRHILHVKSKLCGLTYTVLADEAKVQKQETVIYALTHIGKYDWEMLIEAYDGFSYAFAGDWELMYGTVDDYFVRCNGVIYCDTGDKSDRKYSYQMMVKALKQGIPILIYPEGIWNLSPHLPILHLYSGTAKAAKETNLPIVPIAIDQKGKHFDIIIGERLYGDELEEKELLLELRDRLATLKWRIWEKDGIQKRSNFDVAYWDRFVEDRLAEWSQFTKDIIDSRVYRV